MLQNVPEVKRMKRVEDFPVRSGARKSPRARRIGVKENPKSLCAASPKRGKQPCLCMSSSADDVESSRDIDYVATRGLCPMGEQPSGAMSDVRSVGLVIMWTLPL